MPVEMRKILDKFFLPCFYGLCILGVVVAAFLFMNVKKQQKEALLAYEKNLNFQGTDEVLQLESSENFSNEQLLYSSSDESIIKVDEAGNLISVGEGSAVLTITTKDQKQTQAKKAFMKYFRIYFLRRILKNCLKRFHFLKIMKNLSILNL